jgi:hypothetical protein
MRKIKFLLFLMVICAGINSLRAATVQPKIMVIPYVTEGADIRQAIEQDPNIRLVLSKVREAFDKRGFTTVDFETKLKAQTANNALAQGAQKDLKAMIIQGSGADIYVEVEYQLNESTSGNSVKTLMKACDVSTGAALASKDAFSGQFYTSDVGRLAGAAVEKVADEFLDVIQSKFDDIVTNGRSINVNFTVASGSTITLQKEIGGEELADLLTDWMAKHSYQNNYHIQGSSELEIIFDDVHIPLKDDSGRNYNIQQFDRELRQYLRTLGLQVSHTTKNNTLVITFK